VRQRRRRTGRAALTAALVDGRALPASFRAGPPAQVRVGDGSAFGAGRIRPQKDFRLWLEYQRRCPL